MKYLYLFLILLFVNNCTKPKTTFICGDHKCVNKDEANQYFEENLTLEVRILDKDKKKVSFDLVKLNTSNENRKKIKVSRKNNDNKKVKKLSANERKDIIKEVNKKKKISKLNKNIDKKKEINNSNKKKKNVKLKRKNKDISSEKEIEQTVSLNKPTGALESNKEIIDICSLLDECEIDEISEYLIKKGNKKGFPDISIK